MSVGRIRPRMGESWGVRRGCHGLCISLASERTMERFLNDFDLQVVIALLHPQVDRLTLLTCIPAGKGERFSDSAARGLGYRLGSMMYLGQLLESPIIWETQVNTFGAYLRFGIPLGFPKLSTGNPIDIPITSWVLARVLGYSFESRNLWEARGNTRSIQPDFERAHHHESRYDWSPGRCS